MTKLVKYEDDKHLPIDEEDKLPLSLLPDDGQPGNSLGLDEQGALEWAQIIPPGGQPGDILTVNAQGQLIWTQLPEPEPGWLHKIEYLDADHPTKTRVITGDDAGTMFVFNDWWTATGVTFDMASFSEGDLIGIRTPPQSFYVSWIKALQEQGGMLNSAFPGIEAVEITPDVFIWRVGLFSFTSAGDPYLAREDLFNRPIQVMGQDGVAVGEVAIGVDSHYAGDFESYGPASVSSVYRMSSTGLFDKVTGRDLFMIIEDSREPG